MVNMGLRVLFRPNQFDLQNLYRRLGLDYDDRVLPSICNEVRLTRGFPIVISGFVDDVITVFARDDGDFVDDLCHHYIGIEVSGGTV